MSTKIQKAEPAALSRKKCLRWMPVSPATAGTMWERPGSHLERKSVRLTPFSKNDLERRTQLSGSSEMRQSTERTESPLRRPSSNHKVSPAKQATRASHRPRSKCRCPEAASAPAPTSTGVNSKGKPILSSRLASARTTYGCVESRLSSDFKALPSFFSLSHRQKLSSFRVSGNLIRAERTRGQSCSRHSRNCFDYRRAVGDV